jgi:hypothetical protein
MDSAEGACPETTLSAAKLDAVAVPAQLEQHGLNVRILTFLYQNMKILSRTLCTAVYFRSRQPTKGICLVDIATVSCYFILLFNQTDAYVYAGSRTKARRQMPPLKPEILI